MLKLRQMPKKLQKNLQLISNNMPEMESKFYVKKMGIFGSVARGDDTKKSDIDILVEFKRTPGFFAFLELENYLSQLLNKKKIDLVSKKALKPIIKKTILDEVVYAKKRSASVHS